MSYTIRIATEKDCRIIYDFICLLEETSFDYLLFEPVYIKNLTSTDCIYLVAEAAADGVIGFISCHIQTLLHHCGKVAEIQELFVAEHFRGSGTGYSLVKEMERKLLAANCISFEVTAQNKRAATHQFYERLGFTGTHKKFVKQLG